MRKWSIETQSVETVGVLLFPQFSNHCLANAVEPLRAANQIARRRLYSWHFVTLDGAAVTSSSGLPILPEARLGGLSGDYLFVLPSYGVRALATYPTSASLRAAASRFRALVGMDTGSWLLADAGLLDGRRATIHWDEFTAFAERFPEVEAVPDRFVADQDRLTCGGAMTAFDLVLEIIRRTHGEALGLEVASIFLYPDARRPAGPSLPTGGLVERAVALMSANIERPLTAELLARQLGTTPRRLSAAMRTRLGATPQTVYKRLRLRAALRYAEQGLSVAEIAVRSGYRSPAAMTRAFAAEFGAPPSAFWLTRP